MTATLLVALFACAIGVVGGIFLAAWLDVRQHQREAVAAQASRDAARQYYADADAHAAAVVDWMARRYQGGAR